VFGFWLKQFRECESYRRPLGLLYSLAVADRLKAFQSASLVAIYISGPRHLDMIDINQPIRLVTPKVKIDITLADYIGEMP
jgi:hypothetical protein